MARTRLSEIQLEHEAWIKHNFPDESDHQAVFGMMEELGELCHALLKHQQGIRGMTTEEGMLAKVIDAHCDLIIFSLTLADNLGYDLGEELDRVWAQVRQRDWQANPEGEGY